MLSEAYAPVQAAVPSDERSPQTDALLLDADAEQENVIAQIAAGNSLVVKVPAGNRRHPDDRQRHRKSRHAEQARTRGERATGIPELDRAAG